MRIYTLTSLRFFGALGIYLHHLGYGHGAMGCIAISFFFLLSGFIMAYNYNEKFSEISSKDFLEYLLHRIMRIYPLYVLTFIVSIPLEQILHQETNIKNTLLVAFLLQTYLPIGVQAFSYNGVSWFIADILFFYAITPFILLLYHRTKIIRNGKVLLISLFFTFLIAFIISYVFRDTMEPYHLGYWFIFISPYYRIFDYLLGFQSGLIFLLVKDKIRDNKMLLFSSLEIGSIIFLAISYHFDFLAFDSLVCDLYYDPALIIIIFIFAIQGGILSSHLLSLRTLINLGKISYGIYIIQYVIILYFAYLFSYNIFDTTSLNNVPIKITLFILIVILSFASNRFFEKPIKIHFETYLQRMIRTYFK